MQSRKLNATVKAPKSAREHGGPQRAKRVASKRARSASRDEVAGPAFAEETKGSSALAMFAREVGRVPLLDAKDEVRLARDIEAGEVAMWTRIVSYQPVVELVKGVVRAEVGDHALGVEWAAPAQQVAEAVRAIDRDHHALDAVVAALASMTRGEAELPAGASRDQVAALHAALEAQGEDVARIRTHYIEANLRLVFAIAAQYGRRDVPLADLVQEGTMGLMTAVNRFDHRRGWRFSTYASWWIRHMIGRALADKGRNVRLPVYLRDAKQRLDRVRRDLIGQLGRAPTDEELSAAADISVERIWTVNSRAASYEISLDQTLGEHEDQPRHDVFRDPHGEAQTADAAVASREEARRLQSAFHVLKPQEADILRKRFALEDDREWTLNEIAQGYGVTRERIRQVQNRALDKLRKELER